MAASTDGWVTSPELTELFRHFGGEVPHGPVSFVLDQVAEFWRVWDWWCCVIDRATG